jgi:hypothetical protein
MRMSQARTSEAEQNSALAYKLWLARRFRNGSPEEDLFRAVCINTTIGLTKLKPHPRKARGSVRS